MMLKGLDMDIVMFSILNIDITVSIFVFILVGFFAQTIDGALGMAYGVCSNSFLLSVGVPAPVASASVHMAEIATTAVSGLSHKKHNNIDKKLFNRLVIPGIVGSIIGAFLLAYMWSGFSANGKCIMKIVISIYLMAMGIRIFIKALDNHKKDAEKETSKRHINILALIGGFSDAIGGGGWGPIVTSTLVSNGHTPRYTIGSVNASEFFVTVAQVVVFITMLKIMEWQVIIGLIIGGCISAPFAAKLCKHIPKKAMMIIVAVVIVILQIYSLTKNAISFLAI